jgi:membrane-bound lytic murein transglycosylase B
MKKILITMLISISAVLYTLPSFAIDISANPQVREFINNFSKKYDYNQKELYEMFNQVKFNQSIIDKMNKPGEAKPWIDYRKIFIQPERINQGADYWRSHAKELNSAESKYGVPASIIVGILGVETYYGKIKGSTNVLEALATIAFKYPSRSKYFTSELTEFLLLCREQGWNPLNVEGSYAGAMGLPQFMPSSYRTYAVDGSNNGQVNLFHDHQDVVASVANYLDRKGWHRGEPTLVRANVAANHQKISESQANGKLNYTVRQLADMGYNPAIKVPNNLKAGLLAFETEQGMQYWITFHNFQTIKRYNNSNKYALVVDILGESIKQKVSGKHVLAITP